MVVLRVSVLLLHPGMLHVASHLFVKKGEWLWETTQCKTSTRKRNLSFQTRHQLEKLLDWENSHLYNKLGLKWRLSRQRCDSTLMMEYVSRRRRRFTREPRGRHSDRCCCFLLQVLLVEFIPKLQIYKPD